MEELLATAHLAPSVGNTQPWRFHAVLDRVLMRKLTECSCYGNFVPGGGAIIVVGCDTNAKPEHGEVLWNPRELDYSCAGAMQVLMLGATAMGLGSCWVSLHHGPAHELLKLPPYERVIGGVMLGYLPAAPVSGSHRRNPVEDVITFYA